MTDIQRERETKRESYRKDRQTDRQKKCPNDQLDFQLSSNCVKTSIKSLARLEKKHGLRKDLTL